MCDGYDKIAFLKPSLMADPVTVIENHEVVDTQDSCEATVGMEYVTLVYFMLLLTIGRFKDPQTYPDILTTISKSKVQ